DMGEVPVVMRVAVVVPPVGVVCHHSHGADLHLGVDHGRRHRHDERSDVVPDVEQDGALPGEGVLGRAHTAVVPGSVWKPPPGFPRYGKVPVVAVFVLVVPWEMAWTAPSGVNDGSTSGIVRPATARSSIVTTSSSTRRPFGKPAASPATRPRLFGLDDGGIARFSRSMSDSTGPVKFWKPGTTPAGLPGGRSGS